MKDYFDDITELFLEAKKEEQIEVNPQVENAVREMLKYKISLLKGPGKLTPDRPDIFGFFRKWKYQLIGLPASLIALIFIVFAASNLQFAIPKEDLVTQKTTPAEADEPYTLQAELADEEVDVAEADRALLRTVKKSDVKPLTIDINDLGKINSRALNKIQQSETGTETESATPAVPESKELLSSGTIIDYNDIDFVISKPEPVTAKKIADEESAEVLPEDTASEESPDEEDDLPETQPEPEADEITPTELIQEEEPIAQPDENISEEAPSPTGEFTASLMIAVLPAEEQTLKRIYTQQEQTFVKAVEEEAYPVYYYRDSSITTVPSFDESILKNIAIKTQPSSMTVYYTSDDNVVVELQLEGDTTVKWYLFSRVNGAWTIQKYEKEILNDVVK